ncbi:MAG: hypothetical protein CSA38_04280 [Flavobacteriales bacterium]|nr:MAG: hypothetical protein CSA38_04280 [Flavobacteriales bacterium]
MNKYLFYILLLFRIGDLSAQENKHLFDLKVIKETLPSYLDENPNSARSYQKGSKLYKLFKKMHKLMSEKESKAYVHQLDSLSGIIEKKLPKQKVKVRLKDTLYVYNYVPKEFSDLRKKEDWEYFYNETLKPDFTKNSLVRLATTISMDFADLIKKQIEIKGESSYLNLKKLDEAHYNFVPFSDSCSAKKDFSELLFCMGGDKLYQPVFNAKKDKGCYLFSYECRHGICRDFIFVEKRGNKWFYLASYPSHLVGDEE